jgi:protein TonB
MAGPPEPLVTIDARIIEPPPVPVKHFEALKQPVRKVMPKAPPRQLPSPVQQPITQSPVRTVDTPHPAVSLPEAKVPPGNLTAPYGVIEPGVKRSTPKPALQSSGDAVTPPQFGAAYLNNPKPGYPAFARRMGIEGEVMIKVLVSSQGTALKIEVAHSSGYEILDKAAAEAVKNWRFVPAKHGDSPVEEWVQVPVAFHLKR